MASSGNRTRELPFCSAVPQPTAPPAACPTGNYKEHTDNAASSCVRVESVCKDGRWIEIVQDRGQWQALLFLALNLRDLPAEN